MMRTVNQRMPIAIGIGVWSESGALAVAKIRLAYFYNGFGKKNAALSNVNVLLSDKRFYLHTNSQTTNKLNVCKVGRIYYTTRYSPLVA